MAEDTFRSPGFFDREIDLTQQVQQPTGIPAGVIGTAERGPAFVPVTVGSFVDFKARFGGLDPKRPAPYAAYQFLRHRPALTYLRVLGGGANSTLSDIEKTRLTGEVKNAGFIVTGSAGATGGHVGSVHFIVADHFVSSSELVGMPMFTDNDSFSDTGGGTGYKLVRAAIFTAEDTRLMVLNGSGEAFSNTVDDGATVDSAGKFKLVISSSAGAGYNTAIDFDNSKLPGIMLLTASLNPGSDDYIGKILNTDPEQFASKKHYLHLDFAVDSEIAAPDTAANSVAVVTGSVNTSSVSGDTTMVFRDVFGHYNTRYSPARSPSFISQPFGKAEYDLFHFEALDDGAYPNERFKVSIANVRMSTNPNYEYGTFNVQIRKFDDTDLTPGVIEQYTNVNLDPRSENYIARVIGDKQVRFNFDADNAHERRLVVKGRYPNRSRVVRIVMNDAVERMLVPARALPFGFRGPEVLKTSDGLTDDAANSNRLGLHGINNGLSSSIVPPVPYRFKVTRGTVNSSPSFIGDPGVAEVADSRLYWGVKFERNNSPLNPNVSSDPNPIIAAFTRFQGLKKLDALVTGSGADTFNNNKFTLSRVAFNATAVADLTGTLGDIMREAAYVRNGEVSATSYTINDTSGDRITLGTLAAQSSSVDFNRFTQYAKFSTFLMGGFDGTNILDKNAARMNDRGSSSDLDGNGHTSSTSPGLLAGSGSGGVDGTGKDNNAVFAYRTAASLLTDPYVSDVDLIAVPGIRDKFVVDDVAEKTKKYGLAMYVVDPPQYDEDEERLYEDSPTKPDVEKTVERFEGRVVDNNYAAAYFPDIVITDEQNNRLVQVPPSVAALGAIAFSDRVSYPWFAPAGFNRAALDFVSNVGIRLDGNDRAALDAARINPIATFPRQGFVIFGQKTLQLRPSNLDRVNVRRMLTHVKRIVIDVARRITFEQNTADLRKEFKKSIVSRLTLVQSNNGIEKFNVIVNESNNSPEDIASNRLNGRVRIKPVKAIEYIALDFIVTNAGVEFV